MIKCVNVSKYYYSEEGIGLGLRKINLTLQRNELVAIVGESGSGKTTLLNVLCGMDRYEEGEIYINDEETSYFGVEDLENFRKQYVAFIFQHYNLIESYTVLQNVEAPLILAGLHRKEVRKRALAIIDRVGLSSHKNHKATRLSGGQKQRVVIARALAKDCPIIAADEPTGNLDSKSGHQILELLQDIAKEKLVILVTHQYDQVKDFATRKIRLFDGEIVEDLELKPTKKENLPDILPDENKVSLGEKIKIAFRNLLSAPKKTLLMVIVFAFFSLFVALAYGGFLSLSIRESHWNHHFRNTSISRIIVRKENKEAFTPDELAELQQLDKVQAVFSYDFLLDRQYTMLDKTPGLTMASFLDVQFLPLTVAPANKLIAGRMPNTPDEVVLAISALEIDRAEVYLGKTFAFGDWYGFTAMSYSNLKISGVVAAKDINMNQRQNYFLLQNHIVEAYRLLMYVPFLTGLEMHRDGADTPFNILPFFLDYTIKIEPDLEDGLILFPDTNRIDLGSDGGFVLQATGNFVMDDYYRSHEVEDLRFILYIGSEYRHFGMNEVTLRRLFDFSQVYQVSIIANTDVGVSRLREDIEAIQVNNQKQYVTFYPYYSISDAPEDVYLDILQTVGSTLLLIIIMVISILFTYVIFKSIINTKMTSYAIFRTIGANKQMMMRIIYLENLIASLLAYIIVLIVILITRSQWVDSGIMQELWKFYNGIHYAVLGILLILMSVIISHRYCTRVFSKSVQNALKAE